MGVENCKIVRRSNYGVKMKLKITITGPKVQGVGYRPFLAELAMRLAPRGFEVYNEDDKVVALIETDKKRIDNFVDAVSKERPELAEVDEVVSEEFTGDVMPLWQSVSIATATQMNRAIPLLLSMDKTLQAVKQNTDAMPQIAKNTSVIPETLEEIKGLREDIQPGLAVQLGQVQADIRAIKDRLGMP